MYEFIFILHFMIDVLVITYDLCQTLQGGTHDTLNTI